MKMAKVRLLKAASLIVAERCDCVAFRQIILEGDVQ